MKIFEKSPFCSHHSAVPVLVQSCLVPGRLGALLPVLRLHLVPCQKNGQINIQNLNNSNLRKYTRSLGDEGQRVPCPGCSDLAPAAEQLKVLLHCILLAHRTGGHPLGPAHPAHRGDDRENYR